MHNEYSTSKNIHSFHCAYNFGLAYFSQLNRKLTEQQLVTVLESLKILSSLDKSSYVLGFIEAYRTYAKQSGAIAPERETIMGKISQAKEKAAKETQVPYISGTDLEAHECAFCITRIAEGTNDKGVPQWHIYIIVQKEFMVATELNEEGKIVKSYLQPVRKSADLEARKGLITLTKGVASRDVTYEQLKKDCPIHGAIFTIVKTKNKQKFLDLKDYDTCVCTEEEVSFSSPSSDDFDPFLDSDGDVI